MTTQHTPGPWSTYTPNYMKSVHAIDPDICEMTSTRPLDEVSANAQLIAAAPELLEALQELIAEADNTGGSIRQVTRYSVDKARAAIAKATQQP